MMNEDSHNKALLFKEEGNSLFKGGKYKEAIVSYSNALKLYQSDEKEKVRQEEQAVVWKNRAACYLKLNKYEDTIEDANKALEILVNDTKALYRRCQAFEHLGHLEEAFKDIHILSRLEPKNTSFHSTLKRLGAQLQAKSEKVKTTDGLVTEMFTSLFEREETEERKNKALKNLIILSKEEAGAQNIFQGGSGVSKIVLLLNTESEKQIVSGLLILKGLSSKSPTRASVVLRSVGTDKCTSLLQSKSIDICKATVAVLYEVLEALIEMPTLSEDLKKWYSKEGFSKQLPFKLVNENENKAIVSHLLLSIKSEKISGPCRDECIDALTKAFPKNKLVVLMFMQMKGIHLLLETAAVTAPVISGEEQPLESTENTRMHLSVLLAAIWDTLGHDQKKKDIFTGDAELTIMKYLNQSNVQAHVEGCTALCCLMQGSQESSVALLKSSSFVSTVMGLAKQDNKISQAIAAETLALSTSDKSLCQSIGEEGLAVLKHLYHSKDDSVRVRALVGLCKVGTTGGGSVEDQTFADGATLKLYKSARKYLTKPKKEVDFRRWAAEALSFLSMDAEVKEEFIEDSAAIQAVIDLTKSKESALLYGVCQTLVNLTNTFDMPEVPEEMKKLGEFAKVKLPTLAEKDGKDFVKKRTTKLVKEGVISSLVNLSSTESMASREMIARVFLGVVTYEEHRGVTVQQGGVKALLALADKNTEKGADRAVQAMAKIAISMNPEFAFPGHRSFGLIRPLIKLLHPSKRGVAQYEALLALTNLAQLNDDVRKQIIKQKGLPDIEMLMFDEDEMLKRAATECICNMILNEEVFKMYEIEDSPTERLKLLVMYFGEEDIALQRAAGGALAMLTSSEQVCRLITKIKSWLDIVKENILTDKTEIKFRCVFIVNNMMAANKEIAGKLIESEVLEILMVLSKDPNSDMHKIKELAEQALNKAVEWNLIKAADVGQ